MKKILLLTLLFIFLVVPVTIKAESKLTEILVQLEQIRQAKVAVHKIASVSPREFRASFEEMLITLENAQTDLMIAARDEAGK